MKVFCPEHHKGFFTPRQSPIRCQSRGHVLGELDFQGTGNAPPDVCWLYCCNCEHFCPTDLSAGGFERCPVCSRRITLLYLCDRCFVISFESDTQLQTKNFTLTIDGAPKPSCPGCLQTPSMDLREHFCDEVATSFITALNNCPICAERLDIAPAFPSSVAHYLKRTRSANKRVVTFDYDSELFVLVEDGEFVVVTSPAVSTPVVLPRSESFSSKRDFYELYQDYYHCASVEIGEVNVTEPAVVEAVQGGWRFVSPGKLEVAAPQPKRAVPEVRQKIEVAPENPQTVPVPDRESFEACPNCNAVVETRYAFCWQCGKPMHEEQSQRLTANVDQPERENTNEQIGQIQQSILSAVPSWRRFAADDDEATVQHDEIRVRTRKPSWDMAQQRDPSHPSYGSILKLGGLVVVGLLLISLVVFALNRAESQPSLGTIAEAAASNLPSEPTPALTNAPAVAEEKRENPEEAELRRLREKRLAAKESDRQTIMRAFVKTEKRYPNDYRFPYERAKLTLTKREKAAQRDALKALSVAAQKAIRAHKADEMLDGLEADKRGDFQQLARGHREWTHVVDALKSRDTSVLESNTQ